MLWKILLALAELLDKIIDRFFPTRKEKSITQYQRTAKDVRIRQQTRRDKLKAAQREAQAALNQSGVHDCDKADCH